MKFVIASLPRCGSTALFRVLGSDPRTKIAYEPPYFGIPIEEVRKTASKYFRRCNGKKHVWDPNGWPFRNPEHVSSLDVLSKSHDLIRSNTEVLEASDRVIFLRRKDMFQRTLSDLWGQQTNLWGHDPGQEHDPSEAQKYRAAALDRVPLAIDCEVFGWYMRNAERWENEIIEQLSGPRLMTVYFEELFDPGRSEAEPPGIWRDLLDWLNLEPALAPSKVRQIISPASKLNSLGIYRRIPNFEQLRSLFG